MMPPRQISADPDRAVAIHVREELGIDPDDLPSPWTAAFASFVSFTAGALIPLGPYLLGRPGEEFHVLSLASNTGGRQSEADALAEPAIEDQATQS